MTNVTHVTFHNVYFYSAFKLWIAYSIALAFAALAVVVGLFSIHVNKASFSNNFSTILRIAKRADTNVNILENDTDGANPLPDYIGNATVVFRYARTEKEGDCDLSKSQDAKQPLVTPAGLDDNKRRNQDRRTWYSI